MKIIIYLLCLLSPAYISLAMEKGPNTTNPICSICQDQMNTNQEIETLSCNHEFHSSCIKTWFEDKNTCPNCNNQEFCFICKRKLTEENVRELDCGHKYHSGCANTWGRYHDLETCPICINNLRDQARDEEDEGNEEIEPIDFANLFGEDMNDENTITFDIVAPDTASPFDFLPFLLRTLMTDEDEENETQLQQTQQQRTPPRTQQRNTHRTQQRNRSPQPQHRTNTGNQGRNNQYNPPNQQYNRRRHTNDLPNQNNYRNNPQNRRRNFVPQPPPNQNIQPPPRHNHHPGSNNPNNFMVSFSQRTRGRNIYFTPPPINNQRYNPHNRRRRGRYHPGPRRRVYYSN